jgi:hypothetical protein
MAESPLKWLHLSTLLCPTMNFTIGVGGDKLFRAWGSSSEGSLRLIHLRGSEKWEIRFLNINKGTYKHRKEEKLEWILWVLIRSGGSGVMFLLWYECKVREEHRRVCICTHVCTHACPYTLCAFVFSWLSQLALWVGLASNKYYIFVSKISSSTNKNQDSLGKWQIQGLGQEKHKWT